MERALKQSGNATRPYWRSRLPCKQHLRRLTHQILSAQEAERKKISHELRDEIAQTLLGINVRLLTLKRAAQGQPAQRLKKKSPTRNGWCNNPSGRSINSRMNSTPMSQA